MPSIPKPPAPGSGRNPQPSISAMSRQTPRDHDGALPADATLWGAVLEMERIRTVLEGSFSPWGLDYAIERDLTYQLARKRLLGYLEHPCFAVARWAGDALPPSLGDWATWDGSMWINNLGGQATIVALQGDIVRALIESDVPRPAASEPAQLYAEHREALSTPRALPATASQSAGDEAKPSVAMAQDEASGSRKPSAATIRREHKTKLARQYEANGMKRTEIAKRLDVSTRTIQKYLDGS